AAEEIQLVDGPASGCGNFVHGVLYPLGAFCLIGYDEVRRAHYVSDFQPSLSGKGCEVLEFLLRVKVEISNPFDSRVAITREDVDRFLRVVCKIRDESCFPVPQE